MAGVVALILTMVVRAAVMPGSWQLLKTQRSLVNNLSCLTFLLKMLTDRKGLRDHRKINLINDDLLPIIEQKLKYNAVNQLITKGQQIAI